MRIVNTLIARAVARAGGGTAKVWMSAVAINAGFPSIAVGAIRR